MILIIIGPPGSGKGTQANVLIERFNLYHFETGKFSRELTQINSRIKKIVEKGELIPEDEMTRYVKESLEENESVLENILFDGYPRFPTQYEDLKTWLGTKNSKIDKVIYLNVSDQEVIRRLSARRICEKCGEVYNLVTNPPKGENCDKCKGPLIQRDDDKPDVIRTRLANFHVNTDPMMQLMENDGILIRIDGERPIEVISRDLISKLS